MMKFIFGKSTVSLKLKSFMKQTEFEENFHSNISEIQRGSSTSAIQSSCHTQATIPVTARALLIVLVTKLEHIVRNICMGVPLLYYPESLSDSGRENTLIHTSLLKRCTLLQTSCFEGRMNHDQIYETKRL